jgi:hypothetical protein
MIASNDFCASMVIAQHLSQHIFIGKTEIPSITSYDDVIKN